MKSLIPLILILSSYAQAWTLEDGVWVRYAFNPAYECGKEMLTRVKPGRQLRGCHTKLGEQSFIIVPEKSASDYQCIYDHEMLHANGWEHDENYLERCL